MVIDPSHNISHHHTHTAASLSIPATQHSRNIAALPVTGSTRRG